MSRRIEENLADLDAKQAKVVRKIWNDLTSVKSNKFNMAIILGLVISSYFKTDVYTTIIDVIKEARKYPGQPREHLLERLFIDLFIRKLKYPEDFS